MSQKIILIAIYRQASREALVVEDPERAGVVNYINVAPNNGLGNTLIKGEDFEGSGESVYQPFVSSNNILRAPFLLHQQLSSLM